MAEATEIIRLVIDSSKAVEGSAAATRALEKLERSTASMGGALSRMERGLASVGGMIKVNLIMALTQVASRLFQTAKSALDAAGNMGELAQQMGVSVQGLQALQFAGIQNRLSFEQLETGIAKFSQKMGEAAKGDKMMIDSLNEIGFKVLDVHGKLLPTEKLLQQAAVTIMGISDPARQAAAAVDLFGKAGVKMLPMLKDVAGGFDEMADKAKRGGAIISQEAIDKLDKLGDASERGQLRLRALFAENAAGPLTSVLDFIVGRMEAISRLVNLAKTDLVSFLAMAANPGATLAGVVGGVLGKSPLEKADAAVAKARAEASGIWDDLGSAKGEGNRAGLMTGYARQMAIVSDLERKRDVLAVGGKGPGWTPNDPDGFGVSVAYQAPGVRQATIKPTGGGGGTDDAIAKLTRNTERLLAAANAYAEASERGAKAVADLEVHFKALKAAQDAYGKTADQNKDQVAALTSKIEAQMKAIDKAKNLKDFNLGTVELEKANELLAAENGLINANVETRAIEIAQIKLKQELQAKGITADSEEGRRAIERRGIALETGERLKAQGEEIRKANELWTAPLKSALESIQRVGADAFEQMLTNGTFTFQSLGETFKKIVIRMAAEFMALATIRPVMTVLLNAVSPGMASTMGVGGGSGMPSMGGFGGGMSGFELPSFLGGGTIGELMAATPFASAAPAGGFADIGALMASGQAGSSAGWAAGGIQGAAQGLSVGSMMGAGLGIGMGAYSLATSKNTAQTIGGIGQMIGGGMMLIPGMQIPGMIVSALSVILPSLLGGEEYKWAPLAGANTRFDPSAGGYAQSGSQQNGGGSINGQFAGVGGTLDSLFGRVGGLTDPSRAFGAAVWNNQREGTTSTYEISPTQGSNQLSFNESGDPAKAIDRMIAKVFYNSIQNNAAMNASATLRTALGNKEPTSTAALNSLLDLIDAYDSFGKATVAAKTALEEINSRFASMTSLASEYGLALAPIEAEQKKVTERYARDFIDAMLDPMAVQRRALDDQRKDSIASAEYIRDNVKDVYVDMARITEYWNKKRLDLEAQYQEQSVGQLQALVRRLTYGDLANASPDTSLSGTRGTYEATLAQARAGSGSARANLAGAAEAFASSGRSYFASSAEYDSLIAGIRRDVLEVIGATGGGGGGGVANSNALSMQMAELIGAMRASDQRAAGLQDQVAALTAQLQRRG